MSSPSKSLAEKIDKRRKELRLKQKDLAEALQTTQSVIAKKLAGNVRFSVADLVQLQELLGIEDILTMDDEAKSTDPGIALLTEMLEKLNEEDRRIFYFVAVYLLEHRIPLENKKACDILRMLSKVEVVS